MHRQTGTFDRAKRSPRILDGARRRSPPLLARDWAYDAGGLARYWAPGTSGSLPASFQRESFILSELRCRPSTRAASLTLPPTSSSTRWTMIRSKRSLAWLRSMRNDSGACPGPDRPGATVRSRSEEHTSELQSQSHISYAVFCLKKKKKRQ